MNFELIYHRDLEDVDLESIAQLKAQHWQHPVDSQIAWINNTYQDDDLHILLKENEELIGYVTVANVSALVDGQPISFLGISCLCVSQQYGKRGYGASILKCASKWAEDNGQIMCLLCREKLVQWYEKNRYVLLKPSCITVENEPFEHYFMFYNNTIYQNTCWLHEVKTVHIDKNF